MIMKLLFDHKKIDHKRLVFIYLLLIHTKTLN